MFLHTAATDSGLKRAQSRKASASSSRVEGKPREMSSTGSKKGNLRVELRKGRVCTGVSCWRKQAELESVRIFPQLLYHEMKGEQLLTLGIYQRAERICQESSYHNRCYLYRLLPSGWKHTRRRVVRGPQSALLCAVKRLDVFVFILPHSLWQSASTTEHVSCHEEKL